MRLTSDFLIPLPTPRAATSSSTDRVETPSDVGLHHHGVEGLVDAATGLEDRGEEAALPELGDSELHVAGLGGDQAGPVPVALGHPAVAALIGLGADHAGRFGLDQLLGDEADGVADQIHAVGRLERLEQLGTGQTGQGPSGCSPLCVRTGTHRGSRRWHPLSVDASGQVKSPPLGGTPTHLREPSRQRDLER